MSSGAGPSKRDFIGRVAERATTTSQEEAQRTTGCGYRPFILPRISEIMFSRSASALFRSLIN
jgi:hypothetical protein